MRFTKDQMQQSNRRAVGRSRAYYRFLMIAGFIIGFIAGITAGRLLHLWLETGGSQ